jgi:hypothetical protein
MPTTDVDGLLRESSPEVVTPSGIGSAMAATARAVTKDRSPRPRRIGFRAALPTAVAATAILALGGATIAAHHGIFDGQAPPVAAEPSPTTTVDELELVAQKLAPADLPLPDGVTFDDAKAQVVRVLKENPDLQARGMYFLGKGVVRKGRWPVGQPDVLGWTLKSNVKEGTHRLVKPTGVSAAYVFYARCQWERTMLGGRVTADEGMAALDRLRDVGAYVSDGQGVHRVEHEGIGTVPADLETVRTDFDTNCLDGFGDAPKAAE